MTDHIAGVGNMVTGQEINLLVGLTNYRRRGEGPWLGYDDFLGRWLPVSQTQCEMLDHIAILSAERDALLGQRDSRVMRCPECDDRKCHVNCVSVLREERDALRKDAARYRYLSQGDGKLYITPGPDEGNECGAIQGAIAGAAIDAALAVQP